jgi:hypothetical protein
LAARSLPRISALASTQNFRLDDEKSKADDVDDDGNPLTVNAAVRKFHQKKGS